jgi:phospholipid/cholesterol/gamma-HCH transport system substrate-binding protein
MKKKETKNTATGLLVTITILVVMAGLYYVSKKQQLLNTTFQISATFKDVMGLQVGNNVRFSGINIGVVENIEIFSDSTVKVDLIIDESSRKFIKKNAKAVIGSDGLIGNTILTIIPGPPSQDVIADNDFLVTKDPVSLDDILFKLKTTGENAASISDNLAVLMSNIKEGKGTMGKLLMDDAFATTVDKTVVNLKEGTSGFKNNMEAAKHSFLLKGFFKDKKTRQEKRQERREKRQERREKRKQEKQK